MTPGGAGLQSEPFLYLILDARYDKVRQAGIIVSQAVLVAVAVDGQGRRRVLAVDLANPESPRGTRYRNMDHLTEHKKEALRRAA